MKNNTNGHQALSVISIMRRILTGDPQVSSNKYTVQRYHWSKLSQKNRRNSTGSVSIAGITRPIPPSSFGIRRKNGPSRYCWNYYLSHGICGRIVLASNLKLPNAAGKLKIDGARNMYVYSHYQEGTLYNITVNHHSRIILTGTKTTFYPRVTFLLDQDWTVKEDFKEIRAYTLKSQSQIQDQPLFW